MKKRQVMALILAAALALPNTGAFAGITGVPATVEAAASSSVAFNVQPSGSDSVAGVTNSLESAVAAGVKKTATETTVGDVITVGKNWRLLNGSNALKRGSDNTAQVRYTFPSGTNVTGRGWKNDGDVYYADFEISFEAVEEITAATAMADIKWPELTNKMYTNAAGTYRSYWGSELESGSSSYGTFSIQSDTTSVAGPGSVTLSVDFKLNPGYEFANADTIGGVSVTANTNKCTKTYTVNVTKEVISDIEWPEITVKDAAKVKAGEKVSEALGLSATKGNGEKVEFSICDSTGAAIGNTVLSNGNNNLTIKAAVASGSATTYMIAESDTLKKVTYEVGAPAIKEVKIQKKLKSAADSTYAEATGDFVSDPDDGAVVLKAVDDWTYDISSIKGDVYDVKRQWYKDGEKVSGDAGKAETLEVPVSAPGEYYCEVEAVFADGATKENMAFYKEQPVKSSRKIKAAFSKVEVGAVTTAYNGTSTYSATEFGKLASDVVYTVPVTGATKPKMTLIVEKDGKDVTEAVSSKISARTSDDGQSLIITVDKTTNAGTYTFNMKVEDGNNVAVMGTGASCTINKQTVTLAAAQIKPLNADFVHGDEFSKLTGFEYTAAGANPTTDDKKTAKGISDKLVFTVIDFKNGANGFQNGHFETSTSKKALVNVELKDDFKNDYQLAGLTAYSPAREDAMKAEVIIPVKEKEITLGIENIEIAKGQNLPKKRTITGADFLKEDGITVTETADAWVVYDKDMNEKLNAINSLDAGTYIFSTDITVSGTGVANYKINGNNAGATSISDVKTKLTIYESEHTVGFVTYGDTNIADAKVYHGQAIGTLPTPTRAGYKFIGWYANKDFTEAYDAKAPVTSNIILYAKWEKVSATNGGQNSADAVKAGTTTKTSAGTFAVINASTRTVAYKAASKSAKKVTVPSSVTIKGVSYKVTKIDNNAFKNCKKLTKVSIPSTVTEIGTAAFKGCKKLTSVTIPKNVNKIGKEAFSGCSKLKKVTIKSTKIKSVGKNAFKGIAKKSAIKTPKSKKAAYKKILKKSGYKKTVK